MHANYDFLAAAVALLIFAFAAALLYRRPPTDESLPANVEEAERFQNDPHVHDRCLTELPGGAQVVAEIVEVLSVEHRTVIIRHPLDGPFGAAPARMVTSVERLRWMPADTPLGRYEEPHT